MWPLFPLCANDLNHDGVVNAMDLGIVRANLLHALGPVAFPVAAPASLADELPARRVWDEPRAAVL